jgi:hypothetical protein
MAFMPKPCQVRSHLASYMIDGNALNHIEMPKSSEISFFLLSKCMKRWI